MKTRMGKLLIEKLMAQRKRGRGFQFFAFPKDGPTNDSCWQPMSDFFDKDGLITEAFSDYIWNNYLSPELQ